MEELKKLEEVLEPDKRQKHFAVINWEDGSDRPLTLEDIYRSASSIELHDAVPEKIRSHFATAQNLLVYSWFYYPFNVTAQFLAFVALEYALRERLKPEKRISFKNLVRRAVQEGLVREEGFSHIRNGEEPERALQEELGIFPQRVKKYGEILIESIPFLRNELAHGSSMLHPGGVTSVRICAEFINQLFPGKSLSNAE